MDLRCPMATALVIAPRVCFTAASHCLLTSHPHNFSVKIHSSVSSSPLKKCCVDETLQEGGWGELGLRTLWQSHSTSTFQVKYSGRVSWVLRSVCAPITSAKSTHKETFYVHLSSISKPYQTLHALCFNTFAVMWHFDSKITLLQCGDVHGFDQPWLIDIFGK